MTETVIAPGSVVVLKVDEHLSVEELRHIAEQAECAFAGQALPVVLDGGMTVEDLGIELLRVSDEKMRMWVNNRVFAEIVMDQVWRVYDSEKFDGIRIIGVPKP